MLLKKIQRVLLVCVLSIGTFMTATPEIYFSWHRVREPEKEKVVLVSFDTLRPQMSFDNGRALITRGEFFKIAAGVLATTIGLSWVFGNAGAAVAVTEPKFPANDLAEKICKWLVGNVATDTGVRLSFQIPKGAILKNTVNEHERMVLKEGLVIYDGAAGDILLAFMGDLRNAGVLTKVLWDSRLGVLQELDASKPPFSYVDINQKISLNLFPKISSVEGWSEGKATLDKTQGKFTLVPKSPNIQLGDTVAATVKFSTNTNLRNYKYLIMEGVPIRGKEIYIDIALSSQEGPSKPDSKLPVRYRLAVNGLVFDGKLVIDIKDAIQQFERKYDVKLDLSKFNELYISYKNHPDNAKGIEIRKIGLAKGADDVSTEPGKRGFRFKIINAFGHWTLKDPLTGETITWSQWQPVAGENAWAGVIGPMQVYFQKYGNKQVPKAVELKLAEEVAMAAILLQADNGGIRMAPKGTWSQAESGTDPDKYEWMYNEISTENNLSWYAAFRMLYTVTGKEIYKTAMDEIENYLKASFDKERGILYQGLHYSDGKWAPNEIFATDCQTWAIDVLGPKTIDEWFGEGAAYRMWKKTKELAGICDEDGNVLAVDFTERKEVKSVEWTAGGILACSMLADYYDTSHPDLAQETEKDAVTMYAHMDTLKVDMKDRIGYLYADKRAETKHGWWAAGGILSTASTAWMGLITKGWNPFFLGRDQLPRLLKVVQLAAINISKGKQTPSQVGQKPERVKPKGKIVPEESMPIENLWEKGTPGEYESSEFKSKAIWRDYDTSISMKKGQTIRIEYELEGSDVMGIQLVGVGQSEQARGNMIVLKGVGKKKVADILVPSDSQVRRIAFQIGENAWGYLGGSQDANLIIKAIKLLPKGKSSSRALPEGTHQIYPQDGILGGIGGIATIGSNL